MIQRIRDWWTWFHRDVFDVDIATAGDRAFIFASSRRRFKCVVELEFDRDELVLLGEMIQDAVDGEHQSADRPQPPSGPSGVSPSQDGSR